MELLHLLINLTLVYLYWCTHTAADDVSESAEFQVWGERPIQRERFEDTPSSKSMIISPSSQFTKTGTLKNWTVNFGHSNGSVRLQVWRMRDGDEENYRFDYELIGQTKYESADALGNGSHTFQIWPSDKIRVAPNDTIGIQWKDANPIYYDLRPPPSCISAANASLVLMSGVTNRSLVEGNQYSFIPTTNAECRQYSIQVNMEIKECKQLTATKDNQVEQVFKSRIDADYCWEVAPTDKDHMLRLNILQEQAVGTVLVNNCSFVAMEIRIGRPAITSSLDYWACDLQFHQVPFEAENLGIYVRLVTSSAPAFPESLAIMMSYASKSINKTCAMLTVEGTDELPIQTPNFPVVYESNLDLCWIVTTTQDLRIRIAVLESELEQSYSDECVDYVEVFDGPSEIFPMMSKWCGDELPDTMVSSGHSVLIRFYSGPYLQLRGFKLIVGAATEESQVEAGCITLEATPVKQYLYSPGYPHTYRNDEDICWVISAEEGHRITLKVYDSSIEDDGHECGYDVVTVRDGVVGGGTKVQYPLLRRWCGTSFPPAPILTSANKAHIQLQSDDSVRDYGFYLSFMSLHTDSCTVYGVYPYTIELTAQQIFGMPSSGSAPSSLSTCIILEAQVPKTVILLELIQPLVAADCDQNYIEVSNATDPTEKVAQRWCNKTGDRVVANLGRSIKLRIQSNMAPSDLNFHISYSTINRECESLTVELGGDIVTLNSHVTGQDYDYEDYPDYSSNPAVNYLPNLDVCWVVTSSSPGTSVKVRVLFLDLEGVDNEGRCKNDYMEIRDGENERSPLVKRLCGHYTPTDFYTIGHEAFLRFVTNGDVEGRGFQIQVASNITDKERCEEVNIGMNATLITSPGYPQPYSSNANMCWKFRTAPDKIIQMVFLSYTLESNCVDFIEIYDGETDEGIPMHVVCWPDTPEDVESSGPALFIRFQSDYSVQRKGFKIQVKAVDATPLPLSCMKIIVGRTSSGTLNLNTYPKPYLPNLDVCWVLTTSNHDQRLLLKPVGTDIEPSKSCSVNYIEVLDGSSAEAEPIHRWCGKEIFNMTTSGRSAYVHFKSGPKKQVLHAGFVLEYHAVSDQKRMPITAPTPHRLAGAERPYFALILAGIIGAVIVIIVIAVLVAYIFLRKKKNKPGTGNHEIRMNQNFPMPSPIEAQGDSGPSDFKGVRLNPDGSASYNTAFENPGYATLPVSNNSSNF